MADSSESPGAAPAKKGSLAGKFFILLLLLAAAGAVIYFFFPELLEKYGIPARQELVRVSSPQMRCSIALPGDWTAQARSVGTPAIVGEGGGGCRAMLTTIRVRSGEDLAAFAKRFRAEETGRRKGYGEHATGPSDLGGSPAVRTVFSFDDEGGRRRAAQVVAVRSEYAYILTCESPDAGFEEQEGLFERIAASVRFE